MYVHLIFKKQQRVLTYYTLPSSISIVFIKRVSFIYLMLSFFGFVSFSFFF